MSSLHYRLLADLVLFVIFVVAGLVLIIAGYRRGWRWVRNPWFRIGHLGAIVVVVAQSWLGVLCPLTDLEMALRERAGDVTYTGSFIAHWLDRILYVQWPPWLLSVIYSVFALTVIWTWVGVPPRPFRRRGRGPAFDANQSPRR